MNIFWHEIKDYGKNTFLWILALSALAVLFLSMFPSFASDAANMQKLLEAYPEAVRKAFGISINSITSLLGFYAFIFMYILLAGAIQAMHLGLSIITKEMRVKTADFLFTKPKTRTKMITAKLMAAISLLLITNLVYLIAALMMSILVNSEAYILKKFTMISAVLFFVQLIFVVLGILLGTLIPKIKSVISITLGIVFGFFIVSMFSSVVKEQAIRYFTPFRYFDTAYIIENGSYEMPFLVTEGILIVAILVVSYVIYSKKEIRSV